MEAKTRLRQETRLPEKNPLLQKSPISLVKPTNSEPVSNRHGTYNAGSTSTVEHQCLCLLETKLVSWVTPFFACIGFLASAMANPLTTSL